MDEHSQELLFSPIVWGALVVGYILGGVWGLHNYTHGPNYHKLSKKKLISSFVAGGATGLTAGLIFGIPMLILDFFVSNVLALTFPLFHAPNPYPTVSTRVITDSIALLLFLAYFGVLFGTTHGTEVFLDGTWHLFHDAGLVGGVLLLLFGGGAVLLSIPWFGFKVLTTSTCNENPETLGFLAGAIDLVFLVIFSKLHDWLQGKGHRESGVGPAGLVGIIYSALCVFTLIIVILTLISCQDIN